MDGPSPHESHRSATGYSVGATYLDACREALRRGDRKVGTEHLLLALLMESECLGAVGRSLDDARASLEALDQEAMAAVGVDAKACPAPPLRGRPAERLPLTRAAKDALKAASQEAGKRRFGPRHVLLALTRRDAADAVTLLLARLGVDREAVRAQLRGA